MEYSRFLDCLAAGLSAAVPSCPGWTVAGLARYVGEVYLRKTLAMREGAEPDPWPPKELADEEPLALLDWASGGLRGEFAARKPEDPAGSWYTPRQGRRLLDPADGAGDGHPPYRRRARHRAAGRAGPGRPRR